jgi:hypothetical protein
MHSEDPKTGPDPIHSLRPGLAFRAAVSTGLRNEIRASLLKIDSLIKTFETCPDAGLARFRAAVLREHLPEYHGDRQYRPPACSSQSQRLHLSAGDSSRPAAVNAFYPCANSAIFCHVPLLLDNKSGTNGRDVPLIGIKGLLAGLADQKVFFDDLFRFRRKTVEGILLQQVGNRVVHTFV